MVYRILLKLLFILIAGAIDSRCMSFNYSEITTRFVARIMTSPELLHENDEIVEGVTMYKYRENKGHYYNNYEITQQYLKEFKNNYVLTANTIYLFDGIDGYIVEGYQQSNHLNKISFLFSIEHDSLFLLNIQPEKFDVIQ